jgi:tRNA pseudouridine32 synthase/23S rRNA pseudouridine746 synthase
MGRQAERNARVPLPIRDGVAPSYLWVTAPSAERMLAFLAARFPDVTPASWIERMARGDVVDATGAQLGPDSPVQNGMRIWYYRELAAETPIPFDAQVLFQDEHLLVVDKPHFLPMIPSGRFLQETLLVRLKKTLDLPHLTPIHRLDRETAGVVIFSHNPETRGAYQSLFQKRAVRKTYEALAAPMAGRSFPFTHRSRMVDGDQFFVMREAGWHRPLPAASAHGPQASAAPAHGVAWSAHLQRCLLSRDAAMQGRRLFGAAATAGTLHRVR